MWEIGKRCFTASALQWQANTFRGRRPWLSHCCQINFSLKDVFFWIRDVHMLSDTDKEITKVFSVSPLCQELYIMYTMNEMCTRNKFAGKILVCLDSDRIASFSLGEVITELLSQPHIWSFSFKAALPSRASPWQQSERAELLFRYSH